jgi:hypothetical protein
MPRRAEIEHGRLSGIQVVDDHVEVHLLGQLLCRPHRRSVLVHLLKGDALSRFQPVEAAQVAFGR